MLGWLKSLFAGRSPAVAALPPRAPPPPALASFQDLEALIDRCGLTPARESILARARPCFHIVAGPSAADAPLGATRLGGAPDLPEGSGWPRTANGFSSFLGQLDLADVRARTASTELPAEGLLSLFVDEIDSAGDPVPIRVMLTPAGTLLARLTPPTDEEAFGAYTALLNPVSIAAFTPGVSFPPSDLRLLDLVERSAPDGDLDAFMEGVWPTPPGTIGQLFGLGCDHDGPDLRQAVHARRIGRPGLERFDFIESWEEWERLKRIRHGTYTPWSPRSDDDVRWLLENRESFLAGVDTLRLLIRIDSNKAMGLWINDADPIYLFVARDGLAEGRVSESHGAVTQG